MFATNKHPNLAISPFYVNAPYSYSPYSAPDLNVQYDHRGRLQPYVETSEQRRARIEFLRKRESSRRISAWLEDSSKSQTSDRSSPLKSSSSDTDSLHTIDEDEEVEGEVIYSTSPAAPRASSVLNNITIATTGNGHSGNHVGARPRPLRASSRSSSFSSLSSISEEDDAPCV